MARPTFAEADEESEVARTPRLVLYPAMASNRPSPESVIKPSDDATPLITIAAAPLSGNAIVLTYAPLEPN
jgi:hypothetical protein